MNSIDIIVEMKEKIDAFYRNVEYALPSFNEDNVNLQQIVTKYWSNNPESRYVNLQQGTHVAIHGHLDKNVDFGTIIIVETFEVIS